MGLKLSVCVNSLYSSLQLQSAVTHGFYHSSVRGMSKQPVLELLIHP